VLRVDGGMTASDWVMQFLADIIDAPMDRPKVAETTALGAGAPFRADTGRGGAGRKVRGLERRSAADADRQLSAHFRIQENRIGENRDE